MPIMKDVTSHAPTTVAAPAGAAVADLVVAKEVAVARAAQVLVVHARVVLAVPALVAPVAVVHAQAVLVARDAAISADLRAVPGPVAQVAQRPVGKWRD